MPRCARVKSNDSIFHIMVKSIGDTLLYREEYDKDKYLELIKKYQEIFAFKVYAYCLMDTHAHMIIDACGADISRVMHGINQSYAQYFNKKYKRNGHLFQDRFKSKIVDSERYLITLSGYIHNNPSDIPGYENKIEKFKYSSLGIYIGLRKDNLKLVDTNFIMQIFSKNKINSMKMYLKFVYKCNEDKLKEDMEFENEGSEYRSERKVIIRDFDPNKVLDFVASHTNQDKVLASIKYVKKVNELKALTVLLLRGLCNMKQRDICAFMGSITQSYAAKLCAVGFELICNKQEYMDITKRFIQEYSI